MRNKPRKSAHSTDKGYTLKIIRSHQELPEHYMGLPNDLDYAIQYMNQHEDKLIKRGFIIPRPLEIFSITTEYNNIPVGKKTVRRAREPFTMLAVKVEIHATQTN